MRTLALIALASMAGLTPMAAQDSADVAAVRNTLVSYAAMGQAKNLAGLDTLVAGDSWVYIIEGAGANRSWADYRDHHLAPEFDELDDFHYRYYDIEPQVRGNTAWSPFRYELSARTAQGPVAVDGRGTAVLERRQGRWVIVHLHTSGRRRTSP